MQKLIKILYGQMLLIHFLDQVAMNFDLYTQHYVGGEEPISDTDLWNGVCTIIGQIMFLVPHDRT